MQIAYITPVALCGKSLLGGTLFAIMIPLLCLDIALVILRGIAYGWVASWSKDEAIAALMIQAPLKGAYGRSQSPSELNPCLRGPWNRSGGDAALHHYVVHYANSPRDRHHPVPLPRRPRLPGRNRQNVSHRGYLVSNGTLIKHVYRYGVVALFQCPLVATYLMFELGSENKAWCITAW